MSEGTDWKPQRLPSRSEASVEVARMMGYGPETLPVGLFGRVLPDSPPARGGAMYQDMPEDRYLRDNDFKVLVDTMETFIQHGAYSPSEMREAAVLASIHFEMKRRPVFRVRDGAERQP
jgi:hypothetical protein